MALLSASNQAVSSFLLAALLLAGQGHGFQQSTSFSLGSVPSVGLTSTAPAIVVGDHNNAHSALYSTETSNDAAFSAFADSLDEEFVDDDGASGSSSSSAASKQVDQSWQAKLESLLDPATNMDDRQMLLAELLSANDEIRQSVMDALATREVCSFFRVDCFFVLDMIFWVCRRQAFF